MPIYSPKTTTIKNTVILFVGDAILIIAATYLAVFVRKFAFTPVMDTYTGATFFFVSIYLLCFYIYGLYNLKQKFKRIAYLTEFLLALFTATLLIAIIFYFLPSYKLGRGIFIINMAFIGVFTFSWHLICKKVFLPAITSKVIAIVGAGWSGRTIAEVVQKYDNFKVKCFVDDDASKWGQDIEGCPIIGPTSRIVEMSANGEIESAVIAITHEKNTELLNSIVETKFMGIEVCDMPSFYEEIEGKLPIEHLSNTWVIFNAFCGIKKSIYTLRIKRLLDICFVCITFIVALPIIAITSFAIKIDSRGTVLFRQKRVGCAGKVFEMLKFRSMVNNAETNEAIWARENDHRVTSVGKLIRKIRIDEIPQIWNVLKGDMSFIGPRPERPEFVESLQKEIPFYTLRHSVRPGVTGWAQVSYRYGASKKDALEKLQYDLYYIKNLSPFLDLYIVLKTIRVVLFGKGAR